ncbi:hypothetical protein [Kurthia sibirica]|uniref:Abortive phage infection protein n=1 Tax=Kurthia sibirica TaxID=202750 RepID=A0A2U3AQF0_9BACL|nr:hypothetical protein [Kurthia sibirica]PWI26739.1 hypothetical protein DEX24_00105 [Kurthia sibirica]GEK32731.1 hypothetical protein KSI01_02640 [Kurthia sibirica]
MENYNILLEKLKTGELKTIEVDKTNFYELRKILVERQDFKHFRGIAKQGGIVVYEYLESERS